MTDPLVCIAAIKGAHGVKGEARIVSFTGEPEACFSYRPWRDETGKLILTPKRWRAVKDGFVVAFEESHQREAIDAMKGTRLYVPRSTLPDPGDDEFYHADLIGLAVFDTDGNALGKIVAVPDFGAGTLIEITGPDGVFFHPFTKDSVPEIDLGAGRCVIVVEEAEDAGDADGPV